MSDISLSKAVRSNLLSLQNTATLMAKTQERLATGNKVNSALDNPTNFFTASALNARAGDLNALMDSMANGVQTLQTADNGLKSITKTLESMQSTLRQARQDKTFHTDSFDMTAANITSGPAGPRTLTFTGGAFGTAMESINLTRAVNGSVTSGINYAAPEASGVPVHEATVAWADPDVDSANAGTALNFTVDGVPVTLDENTTQAPGTLTLANAITAINNQLTAGSSTIRARPNDANDALEFYDSDPANIGTASTFVITAGADAQALGLTAGAASPADDNTVAGTPAAEYSFTVNGHPITLNGDSHGTAALAAAAINTQLQAANAEEGLAASVVNGRLVVTGPNDGSGVTIAGGDADAVFDVAANRTEVAPAEAGTSAGAVKSVDELVREINARTLANGDPNPLYGNVRASNDNGKLRIENLSTQELDIGGVSTSGIVDGVSTSGSANIIGNSVRASLADQFNELRDQLDKLSDDASFNGINLLRGDLLRITFNETGTSSIDIQTKDEEALNSAKLDLYSIRAEDLDSDASIDAFLAKVKDALSNVRSQASTFGQNLSIVQNRQDFTKNMINTLQTGAANLTLADMNEEAANLLALQTRQSLSSSSLSLASQADQSVLQLLQ